MEQENDLRFYNKLVRKSSLKSQVYQNTCEAFQIIKKVVEDIKRDLELKLSEDNLTVNVELHDRGEYEAELRFAGDTLLFTIHSNVFEFPKAHEVMRTPYILEDKERSYSGVIHIYNFLTDSFRYNRFNDLGYLVARVYINKEKHFLVEGKHQTGFYYNQFMNEPVSEAALRKIIESAIAYSIDFDLLTPPYDLVKQLSVSEARDNSAELKVSTGKRVGFKFQVDHDKENLRSKI